MNRRFYFLLWGWYVFLAFLLQFFLKTVLGFAYGYVVWFGVFPVMAIMLVRLKAHPQEPHTTYLGHSIRNLWTGIGISFFVLSLVITRSGSPSSIVYPFFILLYGLGIFVSGRLLRFRPLIAGGIFCWALAVVCPSLRVNFQFLAAAAAILFSYIIPAYLLKPDVQTWKTISRTKKAWR